ncbi:hypothetical protein QYE76_051751 [Lolium multiflorum]|uniref:Tf2-1-like SH3-like domain-containing protein n=1 Tax=Lolium multiflorum TaxID=4521 RepID=A0AAD8WI71_LOLMU|nr:hypothetical protein QYE76_051751 [Lolium multiflorum]
MSERKSVLLATKSEWREVKDNPSTTIHYVLICKGLSSETNDLTNIPSSLLSLLKEFQDVFPDELPLPPLRGIEHRIDLIPGAPLPNRAAYRTNPEDTKEIQRQIQDLLAKGKERFPQERNSKLKPRGDGPFKVLKRINNNAYVIDIPTSKYLVSNTFNISDLSPHHGDEEEQESRTTLSQGGGDDSPARQRHYIKTNKPSSWSNDTSSSPSTTPRGTSTKTQAMETKTLERELETMKMELRAQPELPPPGPELPARFLQDAPKMPSSAASDRNFRPRDRNFRPLELPPKFRPSSKTENNTGCYCEEMDDFRNLAGTWPELPAPKTGTSADRNFRPRPGTSALSNFSTTTLFSV